MKAPERSAGAASDVAETVHNASRHVVNMGTDAVREVFSRSAEDAQKAHERAGREGAEAVSRVLDAFTRTLNDFTTISRENIDVAVEVHNIVTDIAKTTNAELLKCANGHFSDNLDICNEAFTCRNLNDALELGNKWVGCRINHFFAQSSRLADMLFQLTSEAVEPVNEHILESTERLGKSFAA
jgi:hypothetical protein